MIPVQLIIAGAIAVTSFGAAWTYQGNRYASILAERETDHAIALVQANGPINCCMIIKKIDQNRCKVFVG